MTQALLQDLEKLIGTKQGDYEIEARIGSFRGPRFISGVNAKEFYRVLSHFTGDKNYKYLRQEVSERTEEDSSIKPPKKPDVVTEATFTRKSGPPVRESFIDVQGAPRYYSTKKSIGKVDFVDYFTRFSVAEEHLIPKPEGLSTRPQSLRIKRRWSFVVNDTDHPLYPYRIDLTNVTGWYINERNEQVPINSYEIELEVRSKVNPLKDLWPGVQYMLRIVQNTEYPVTSGTISNVISSFNNFFTPDIESLEFAQQRRNPRWTFNKNWNLINIVNKPINLPLAALNMPELLAVTDKADGERRLLYIRRDGAYLLYPPNDVMRYLRTPPAGSSVQDDPLYMDPTIADKLDGTVLDGELVHLPDGSRQYLAFDILVDRKEPFRQVKFVDRIKVLKNLLTENPITGISMKEYYLPGTDNFYQRVSQVFVDIENKEYGNDGLIFNNITDTYSKKALVYKWKPPQQLTIDFNIRQIGSQEFELWVKNDAKTGPKLLQFRGTDRYPFSGVTTVKELTIGGVPLSTGQIVEMVYKDKNFVPVRIRYDRDEPNNLSTAIGVWNDIMDPITKDTIRGQDLKLMRKYHNVVKKKMIEPCTTLVDIGSGMGGDIHKWKRYGISVLAVEPNPDYIYEFHTRLMEAGYKPKFPKDHPGPLYTFSHGKSEVAVLESRGQETDKIVSTYQNSMGKSQRVGCLSMFNSLTFFFDQEKSLDALIETIDKLLRVGGNFMGMVMDGDMVKSMLTIHHLLKQKLASLGPDQYYNLDTEKKINKKNVGKLYKDEKWRIVSKDKNLIRKTIKKLNDPDRQKISEAGWTVKRTKKAWTDSAYGNEIIIDLDANIVNEQKEYLVDFGELVRKLAEKNIVLKNDYFLASNTSLSPSQQDLSRMFRAFEFVKRPEPTASETTLLPLTGSAQKRLEEAQENKRNAEGFLQMAETELADAKEKLAAVEEKLSASPSVKDAQRLQYDRVQFKQNIAAAEKKIVQHKSSIADFDTRIKKAEEELGKLKPVIVTEEPKKVKVPKPSKPMEVIETSKVDPTVAFTAVEGPITTLKPEQREIVSIGKIKLMRIGVEDAECPLGALLRAAWPSYIGKHNDAEVRKRKSSEKEERTKTIKNLKRNLISKVFKKAHKNEELGLLNKYKWEDAKQILNKCQSWQWLDLWKHLAQVFDANIVVVTVETPFTTPQIYRTGDTYKDSITIYNHDGVFDTLAKLTKSGKLVTKGQLPL